MSVEEVRIFTDHQVEEATQTLALGDRIEEDTTGNAPVHLTDLGNATYLVNFNNGRFLHSPSTGDHIWDGKCYRRDEVGGILRLAVQSVRQMQEDALCPDKNLREREEMMKHALRSEAEPSLKRMINLARTDPRVAITADRLDSHPLLLNTPTGTVDLQTGELRPHRKSDRLTRCTNAHYDKDACAPLFIKFLLEIFGENIELIEYVQRFLGYGATGLTIEQILSIWYGAGANGKSVLAGVIEDVLGSGFTMTAPKNLLLLQRNTHTTDLTDLRAQRLVFSQEIAEGDKLAEALVKQMTGSDRIRARRMYQDNSEWSPTHQIILVANHKPVIQGTDWAIWRRIQMIPFVRTIPESKRDLHLREKLLKESPGILNWIITGAVEWHRRGLDPPDCVMAATEKYRKESDPLTDFIEEECVEMESVQVRAQNLYLAFKAWADREGRSTLNRTQLKKRLEARSIYSKKKRDANYFEGIGLRVEGGG